MEFFQLLEQRQSVRAYTQQPVDACLIERILSAVRTAPSAGNFQAYEVYVVTDRERIAELTAATFNQQFIKDAPTLLVFCSHAARCRYDNPSCWALQDTSIAATMAHLAITDLGLATCWIGAFDPSRVARILEMPSEHSPLAILPVGYPAENPPRTERRELSEFVHRV